MFHSLNLELQTVVLAADTLTWVYVSLKKLAAFWNVHAALPRKKLFPVVCHLQVTVKHCCMQELLVMCKGYHLPYSHGIILLGLERGRKKSCEEYRMWRDVSDLEINTGSGKEKKKEDWAILPCYLLTFLQDKSKAHILCFRELNETQELNLTESV